MVYYSEIFTVEYLCKLVLYSSVNQVHLYFSQKQLPRKMKSRLVIIACAGYILWQLFLRRLYIKF